MFVITSWNEKRHIKKREDFTGENQVKKSYWEKNFKLVFLKQQNYAFYCNLFSF